MLRFIALLMLSLLVALPVSAQEATEEAPTFVFYNSPNDRFHVLIPPGWENRSTDAYAHFVSGTEQIYALPARTSDTTEGMQTALQTIGVEVNPFAQSEVRLSNGTWSQKLYTLEDGRAVTAFGQSFEGMTYTIAYVSENGARPLLAQSDIVTSGIAGALELVGAQIAPNDLGELSADSAGWVQTSVAGDTAYSVTARQTGGATFVSVQPAETAQPPEVFFYTLLLDFFVTPETTDYMALGLAAVGLIMLVVLGTMWLRWRNLRQDMRTLDALGDEGA